MSKHTHSFTVDNWQTGVCEGSTGTERDMDLRWVEENEAAQRLGWTYVSDEIDEDGTITAQWTTSSGDPCYMILGPIESAN